MPDLPSREPQVSEGRAACPVTDDDVLRHTAHELVHLFVQVLELDLPLSAAGTPVRPGSLEGHRPGAARPRRAGGTS